MDPVGGIRRLLDRLSRPIAGTTRSDPTARPGTITAHPRGGPLRISPTARQARFPRRAGMGMVGHGDLAHVVGVLAGLHVRKRRESARELRYNGDMHTNHTQTGNLPLNADNCYQALVSRDARFDGRFYVGVSSTRIYCRVVCPAKTPRRENCTFYPSAAAAE